MAEIYSSHTRAFRAVALLCLMLSCRGCGEGNGSWTYSRKTASVAAKQAGEKAVAAVDGERITLADVEEIVRQSNLTPRQALSRLEAERLLMAEADRRGFGDTPEVESVAKQSAVQSLLIDQIERRVGVTSSDLQAAYDRSRQEFNQPELRSSVHVLAKLNREADESAQMEAEALVREAIQAFAEAKDPNQVLDQFRGRQSKRFAVIAERLPPVPINGPFVPEFSQALFSQPQVGVIPKPVRTSFGWHAIYVTEILPEKHVGLEQAAEVLRPRILWEKRTEEAKALIGRLRRSTRVVKDEPAVKWLLSADLSAVFQR